MSIIIFILVIIALIVVHEFGHFLVAKWSGMRVEEFGIGYPPRIWGKRYKGTEYTINWLPFGGFVKILGEDDGGGVQAPDSFGSKPRIQQALVLVAGIVMNILFAWVLLSTILALGTPRALTPEEALRATDTAVLVSSVLPGTPAAEAGLAPGDEILSARQGSEVFTGYDPKVFSDFVAAHANTPVTLSVKSMGKEARDIEITPATGISATDPSRAALGIQIATIGVLAVPLLEAPIAGARVTYEVTKETALGLVQFFTGIFTFTADLSQVSGPVGIVGAVGSASAEGFTQLLSITAIISINLALINLVPVPALDGGRLLFVIIEAVIRRPISKSVANAVNMAGFAFLLLLMFVVTAHDIWKLVA